MSNHWVTFVTMKAQASSPFGRDLFGVRIGPLWAFSGEFKPIVSYKLNYISDHQSDRDACAMCVTGCLVSLAILQLRGNYRFLQCWALLR